MKKIDSLFSNLLPAFLRGEVDSLKVDELISAREILLFYLLQTPTGVFSSDNMFSSLAYSIETFLDPKTKKETKEIIRTDDVKEALVQMMIYGIDLLDMEAVILSSPSKSSFLLGPFPFTLINPYFSKAEHAKYIDAQVFELRGSVIVLPLSPERALCIYDRDTYTPVEEDGIAYLTKEDIDMLNSAMLYNSGDCGGVIHTCGIDYINELYGNLDDMDFFREIYLEDTLDVYPFSTALSVLKVIKEAEEEFEIRQKDFIRPFVEAMLDYDEKHLEKIKDDNVRIKVLSKRLKEGRKILNKNIGADKKRE